MPNIVEPRSVSPALSILRSFLLGRKHTNALRFADGLAARTQPPPVLPEGPAHKLAANYYCNRDGRREIAPPLLLAGSSVKTSIAPGESASATAVAATKKQLPTPGKVWQWD